LLDIAGNESVSLGLLTGGLALGFAGKRYAHHMFATAHSIIIIIAKMRVSAVFFVIVEILYHKIIDKKITNTKYIEIIYKKVYYE